MYKAKIGQDTNFPIAAYASETWTIKRKDKKLINAFEMEIYKKMLGISWSAHRINA